jgi:hypothetical protein
VQVAYVGEPFELDLGYTPPKSPTLYRWEKNGNTFRGDGGRVTLDYQSICFTSLKIEDAGQYTVEASVKSKVVKATTTLQGIAG